MTKNQIFWGGMLFCSSELFLDRIFSQNRQGYHQSFLSEYLSSSKYLPQTSDFATALTSGSTSGFLSSATSKSFILKKYECPAGYDGNPYDFHNCSQDLKGVHVNFLEEIFDFTFLNCECPGPGGHDGDPYDLNFFMIWS